MKKKLYIYLLFFCITSTAFSQFDAQNSQYMLNPRAFNPAAVGESGMIETILQHRIQWVGMPNAGQTTTFGIGSPIKIGNKPNGLGVKILIDEFARIKNQAADIQYAYKFDIGDGRMSLGLNVGFLNISINTDTLRNINVGDYHEPNDNAIPQGSNANGNKLSMGVGAWYSTNKWYTGISVERLNQPLVEIGDLHSYKASPTLFITGGYTFQSEMYPNIEFKPTALFRSDFVSWQIEAGATAEISQKYRAGLAYRYQDAVIVLAGMNVAPGLFIGYAYDFPASTMLKASSGSHELMLSYSFDYVFSKTNNKYKSIRIL